MGLVDNRYTVMFRYDLRLFIVYWAELATASHQPHLAFIVTFHVCHSWCWAGVEGTLVTIYIIATAFSLALCFKTKENVIR